MKDVKEHFPFPVKLINLFLYNGLESTRKDSRCMFKNFFPSHDDR
jgi:hypothetical protein